MKRIKYVTLIGLVIPPIFWLSSCDFLKTYDREDLTNNYDEHEKKIGDLINYFDSIVPQNTYVNIEINDLESIDIFHVKQNDVFENNWNVNIKSKKADSLLSILNWKISTTAELKSKLDAVNCISISNFNQHTLGYQRSGMSKFNYVIYDETLNKEQINIIDESCSQIFYRDNVILDYASGATGSMCFPDRFRE